MSFYILFLLLLGVFSVWVAAWTLNRVMVWIEQYRRLMFSARRQRNRTYIMRDVKSPPRLGKCATLRRCDDDDN